MSLASTILVLSSCAVGAQMGASVSIDSAGTLGGLVQASGFVGAAGNRDGDEAILPTGFQLLAAIGANQRLGVFADVGLGARLGREKAEEELSYATSLSLRKRTPFRSIKDYKGLGVSLSVATMQTVAGPGRSSSGDFHSTGAAGGVHVFFGHQEEPTRLEGTLGATYIWTRFEEFRLSDPE